MTSLAFKTWASETRYEYSEAVFGSAIRCQLYTKSSAVNLLPSDHLRLSRSVAVYVKPSLDTSTFSAKSGFKSPFSSTRRRLLPELPIATDE